MNAGSTKRWLFLVIISLGLSTLLLSACGRDAEAETQVVKEFVGSYLAGDMEGMAASFSRDVRGSWLKALNDRPHVNGWRLTHSVLGREMSGLGNATAFDSTSERKGNSLIFTIRIPYGSVDGDGVSVWQYTVKPDGDGVFAVSGESGDGSSTDPDLLPSVIRVSETDNEIFIQSCGSVEFSRDGLNELQRQSCFLNQEWIEAQVQAVMESGVQEVQGDYDLDHSANPVSRDLQCPRSHEWYVIAADGSVRPCMTHGAP